MKTHFKFIQVATLSLVVVTLGSQWNNSRPSVAKKPTLTKLADDTLAVIHLPEVTVTADRNFNPDKVTEFLKVKLNVSEAAEEEHLTIDSQLNALIRFKAPTYEEVVQEPDSSTIEELIKFQFPTVNDPVEEPLQ